MSAEAAQFPPDLKFKQTDLHMAVQIACAQAGGAACSAATAGHKILTKASFSSEAIQKADGALTAGKHKPIETGQLLTQQTLPTALNADTASIRAAVNKLQQVKALTDSDVFTNNGELREYIKTQIHNLQPADKEQPPVATQISEHISKNYGAGSTGFSDKIWKAAKDTPLKYLTAKQIERKKLEIVTDIDDLSAPLALSLSKEETKPENLCETASIAKSPRSIAVR
ncbi:uncharacterized protein TEOVI_000514700 [Trypanosoma equiperdum]|uniref:Trypanosome variant surface glycoprotein A-type N-terminal domain-containing protein n=1 Tax=Trypanosoma equiperdum TaxID=5694 RepID=A0A1G4HYE9_TRYEQ|nr:hypothetical protein, conserved [Trypanosoma equiperdum]